jgi:chromosome segregation ATPase
MNNELNQTQSAEQTKRFPWSPVLAAGLLAVGVLTFYQNGQTESLRHQVAASQQDNAALRATLSKSDVELQAALEAVRVELANSRQTTSTELVKAQASAKRHADVLAGRIEKAQRAQSAQLSAELTKVKESTSEAASKLDGITSEVGSVKTEVGSVKTEVASANTRIDETRNDLQRARGDLGLMSGLIATNSKEIQVLRDLGDRNIFEFNLAKAAGLQKVGDIQVMVKKVDAKRNRYTVTVLADDKLVEKRDKSVNEPVQFYTAKARQPYELVVNTVAKDRLTGYLATPKVTLARGTVSAQ